MADYRIIASIDPTGVSAGRAKISQELSGIESDVRRTGNTSAAAFDRMGAGSLRAGTAAAGLAGANRAVGAEATAMAAAAQASARGLAAQADAVRLNSVAMRETLVVARELSRGNFTRLPGSLTLLGQGIASQGGIAAYGAALANTLGLLKKTQDAELALSAADAQSAASAVRAMAERAAANVQVADTEIALAEAQLRVTAGTSAEATAQARLAAAHEAVAAAAAESAIAEDAVAVSEARAGEAALAAAAESTTTLNPWAIGLAVVTAAVVGLYFAFREEESAVQKATDKLVENAKKADIDRQAHDLFQHTLEGVTEALRKNQEAIDKANDANKAQAELELTAAALAEQRLQRIYTETEANLNLAKSRLAAAMADPNRGTNLGTPAQAEADAQQAKIDDLQKQLDKNRTERAAAASQYDQALAQYAVSAGQRDTADIIKRRYEGPGGLLDQASKAAQASAAAAKAAGNEVLAHKLLTTELTKQVELIHAKEKAELAAAARAESDAKKQGQILALPLNGRITTRFGQTETGVGVGPHVHQGVDIAAPVGSPVYARAGGTVDFARQMSGYGNVIQINFGGGVTARYGHVQKFNVKPGDVVNAGDVIAYSGGERGAEGAGDSTGPHLHYEERVGGKAVNPLTAKVSPDTEGAQQAGYRKAEEAAKAAAARAQSEKDFVERTIDAANETALPKIDALAAKIKKVMDDYRHQFHEAMSGPDAIKVTQALTDADAREVEEHFRKAYIDPLKPLQEGLGQTAVQQKILNAEQKEMTDRGVKELLPAQKAIIENYYQQEDVLSREDQLIRAVQQPLEDYRNKLLAINKALADGKINHVEYIAQIADMNAPLRQFLDNAPQNATQKGGFNVKDPTANTNLGDKASRNYQSLGDASQATDEDARYASELKSFNDFRQQHQDLDLNWNSLEESLHQRHVDNLNKIDESRRDMQLSYGEQIADSVYQIAAGAFGKQSGLARAAFGVEKAFTIARASLAIYQDVAQAMKVGFPANIPLIAEAFAQGAVIVSAIRSITVPSSAGYMLGGYTGDTGRATAAGIVHGQEFVVNADATSRNRALLEAINSGSVSARTRSISNDNAPSRALNVQVHNYAGADIEVQRGPTVDDIVVIAKKTVRDEAAKVVAEDMTRANSKTSKALRHNFGVDRKRA